MQEKLKMIADHEEKYGQMSDIKILDACCGSRMFWFDKNESHTTFMDIRQETFEIHGRKVNVNPDVVGDFRDMPFISIHAPV